MASSIRALAQPLVDQRYVHGMAIGVLKNGERHTFGVGRVGADDPAEPTETTLYEIGFQHFWHGDNAAADGHGGDLLYIQGHLAPGIYSRAFLEGRLTAEQLDNFRQETGGDSTVKTKIIRGGPADILVDYRLRQRDGTWKIIDVIINSSAPVRATKASTAARTLVQLYVGPGPVQLALSPSPHHFDTVAYAASKGGVLAMSRNIAASYAPKQIRVNVLAPGLIETPMSQRAVSDPAIVAFLQTKQPLGPGPGTPDDCADGAVFLCSDEARFITGNMLTIDGGWRLSDGQHAN